MLYRPASALFYTGSSCRTDYPRPTRVSSPIWMYAALFRGRFQTPEKSPNFHLFHNNYLSKSTTTQLWPLVSRPTSDHLHRHLSLKLQVKYSSQSTSQATARVLLFRMLPLLRPTRVSIRLASVASRCRQYSASATGSLQASSGAMDGAYISMMKDWITGSASSVI